MHLKNRRTDPDNQSRSYSSTRPRSISHSDTRAVCPLKGQLPTPSKEDQLLTPRHRQADKPHCGSLPFRPFPLPFPRPPCSTPLPLPLPWANSLRTRSMWRIKGSVSWRLKELKKYDALLPQSPCWSLSKESGQSFVTLPVRYKPIMTSPLRSKR